MSTVAGVDSAGESRDRIALLSVLAPDEMPDSLEQVVSLCTPPILTET